MKKINLILSFCISMMLLFLVTNVKADLGTFNQYECLQLKTILNADNVTLASITYPNGSQSFINQLMSKNGLTFSYNYCDTKQIGQYIYDYHDNENKVYENTFTIRGNTNKGLLSFDITSTLGIILFLVMMGLGFTMLFMKNLRTYGSAIIIICGFLVLFSGISLIFSVILIIIGVLSIIYHT